MTQRRAAAGTAILADIGHLLESAEGLRDRIVRALELVGEVVPYEHCALLDACSSETPVTWVVPEVDEAAAAALREKLGSLLDLASGRDARAPVSPPSERGLRRAQVAVPLIAVDDVIGVVLVERAGLPYDEEHLQFLSVVAAQLGAYLANVRLQAEEQSALRATRRAADLLERMRDGFLDLDAGLRCVAANPAAAALAGVERGALVGAPLADIVRVEGDALVGACERAAREQLASQLPALRLASADRWLDCDVYPRDGGVSVFLRDITDRQRAAEFRDRLLGIIGHDLRTPLTAIKVNAQALLGREARRAAGGSEARPSGAAERIARSATRMSGMVDQLLEFTRIRLGHQLRVERAPGDMGELCRDVVGELRAAYPSSEIRMETSGDLRGAWDLGRISQAISNLASNALQHGAPDRPVRVVARDEGSAGVAVEVHNEGTPIPAAELGSIFAPFRRGADGPQDARSRAGLGLGLFIAEHMVRAHGGRIEVRSSASATTFAIHLPRR